MSYFGGYNFLCPHFVTYVDSNFPQALSLTHKQQVSGKGLHRLNTCISNGFFLSGIHSVVKYLINIIRIVSYGLLVNVHEMCI